MSLRTNSWETSLLARARQAIQSPTLPFTGQTDDHLLDEAYDHCATITETNSRTFYMASRLLPHMKRRAAHALYAFCRISDDIVDETEDNGAALTALNRWLERTHHAPPEWDKVLLAWANTRATFSIPQGCADDLIRGLANDLTINRYATFEQLAEYCYGVASTVGLMTMHIIGFSGEDALPYAVKLGVALQLTNILRDVREDWEKGRLYLPQDELAAFHLTENDIAQGSVDNRWRDFMRYQIERNRQLYAEAQPGVALLDSDGRFAIGAAATLYAGILDDIEAHDYDVFSRRAHLTTRQKLSKLPRIWWTTRWNQVERKS